MFIKEGCLDPEFKKDVIDLNRYEISTTDGFHSLKSYVKMKAKTQDKIFYLFSPNKTIGNDSPYMYPLKKAGIPVLITSTQID
jgi:HSP90 family molecular chaperone